MSFPDKTLTATCLPGFTARYTHASRRATELITSPAVLSQFCEVHSYSEKII